MQAEEEPTTEEKCFCGKSSWLYVAERSGALFLDRIPQRRSHAHEVYGRSNSCYRCNKQQIDQSIENVTKGLKNGTWLYGLPTYPFPDKNQMWFLKRFAGKCYAALARQAVELTKEKIKASMAIDYHANWTLCVHQCPECLDCFTGADTEMDHHPLAFHDILLAFLDCHVRGWCEMPSAKTADMSWQGHAWGMKADLRRRTSLHETAAQFWARNEVRAKELWRYECLTERFVRFHNSIAVYRNVCMRCHDLKTRPGEKPRECMAIG